MDDPNSLTSDTLGMNLGPVEPGSQTGMETTVSAGLTPSEEEPRSGHRPLDLSFLETSNRAGSIGRVGEYEITGVQGRGAMGIVLKGHDRELNRTVAVKVQDPSIALNRRARARFLHEARAVALISDPHVVTIYKVNAVKDLPYLAMEYVETSLRERVKAHAPLSLIESLRIAEQVARGLAAAHGRGILHRDIKPANILIDDNGRTKISDFGLAVAREDGTPLANASPDRVAGTPGYMSPEQIRGEALDARSDLFSLGCVIHAMFTSHSPFARECPADVLTAILESEPESTPLPEGCPIAADLKLLLSRLLAKDMAERPACALEVATWLEGLAKRAEAPPPQPVLDLDSSPPVVSPRRPRRRLAAGLMGAGVFVAAAFVVANLPRPAPNTRPGKVLGSEKSAPHRPVISGPTMLVGPKEEFPNLASALARATPGSRIILTTADVQQGPFLLADADRFRDITIEARIPGTTLAASGGSSVIEIDDVPGITLRGLKIETINNQFAVTVTGASEGVTLDHLSLHSPVTSRWTQVYIHDQATGTADRPIVVSHSQFEVGHGGVTVEGGPSEPVAFVQIRENRFSGHDEQVHVLQAVHDITVSGNLFLDGQAITLNLAKRRASSVLISNNTFFRTSTWLHPAQSVPVQHDVLICNNAMIGCNDIDVNTQDLSRMARGKWQFRNNLWEPGSEATAPTEGPLAESRPRLDVVSRDPASKDFLRPTPNSVLATSGMGGSHPAYVGAFAPLAQDAPGQKSGPAQ